LEVGFPTYWPMPKVGVAELVSTVTLVAAVSAALRITVPVTVPPPFPGWFVKEKWKVSAPTGPADIETKNADKIGTKMRPVTNFAALRFMRQPSRPNMARPVMKRGRAPGSGTCEKVAELDSTRKLVVVPNRFALN